MLIGAFERLKSIRNLKMIFFMAAFKALTSIIFVISANYFLDSEQITNRAIQGFDTANKFVLVVIFGPLVETFIFQFLVIELILIFFKRAKLSHGEIISIIIASFMFSMTHGYSTFYIFYAFISGFIYAYFYIFARKRKGMNGYLTVAFVHSFSNFSGFIYEILTS
jgi:hypothetical protein